MAPKEKAKAKPAKADKEAAAAKKAEAEEEEAKSKVQQPDWEAHTAAVNKKNEEVEKLQKQLADLGKKIESKSVGKDEFFSKKNEIRRKMDEFQGEIDKCMATADKLKKERGDQNQKAREARNQLNDAKKAMKFSSEEDIDTEIANIEFRMWTASLSLKEEKAAVQQISDLKKQKPKLHGLKQMESAVSSGAAGQAGVPLKEQMDGVYEKIRELRDEKKKEQEAYGKLMEIRKKQMEDMPEFFEKRDELNKKIGDIIRERNDLRADFRKQENEYKAYLAEQRAVRAEKGRAEREKRQAEWEARKKERDAEKAEEQPYLAEIALLEQTIHWCKAQLPKEEGDKKEETKAQNYDNPDGSTVLVKKGDREEEFYYAPTKKKGLKQKGKKEKTQGIKHNMETFKLFDALKVDAPMMVSDVSPVMEKLQKQLEDYNEKVKVWEKERSEKKDKVEEPANEEGEKEAEAAAED